MLRGLEGRRIALFASKGAPATESAATVARALEEAGAQVQRLETGEGRGTGSQSDWQSARYAALVIIGDDTSEFESDPRLVQLVREFMVADKPVAALGSGVATILESAGAAGRNLAASGALKSSLEQAGATVTDEPIRVDEALITGAAGVDGEAFASRLVAELAERLEERDVDEMSEQSFPASDPPATTPATVGRVPDADRDARP